MANATATIPDDVQRQLKEQIEQSLQNVPQAMGVDDIRKGFCDAWPTARAGLEGLRAVLNFVPGVNAFAGPAISIVLTAGDAAKSVVCK